MKSHDVSVHEGKKPFSCSLKSTMHQFMKEKTILEEPNAQMWTIHDYTDPGEEFGLRLRVSIDPVVPSVPTYEAT